MNFGDLAGLAFKTVTQNSGKIADTVQKTVTTVKKAQVASAIKAKYKPGQAFSAADNAAMQATKPVIKPNVPETALRMPTANDKKWEELSVPEKVLATGKEKNFLDRTKMTLNTIGSSMQELAQDNQTKTQKLVDNHLKQGNKPDWQTRTVETMNSVFGTPALQVAEGLNKLSGGDELGKPEIIKGLTSTVFGGLGATPAGAVFNGILGQPEIKPIADQAFGVLESAKSGLRSLSVVKDLPEEAKAVLDTAIDIGAFELLHKGLKLPFKTTKTVEMAHPTTGEMVKVKVPTDTAGWKAFKDTLAEQVNGIRNNPIEFLKKQQIGMSIKDVSGEVPRQINPELINSDIGAQVQSELANSTAGGRVKQEDGTYSGYSSTFPEWVPSDLRSTTLFNKVQEHLLNNTVPKFKKQIELYDIIRDRMETQAKTVPTFGERVQPEPPKFNDEVTPRAEKLNAEIRAKQQERAAEVDTTQKKVINDNQNALEVQTERKGGLFQTIGEGLNPFKHMDESIKTAWQDRVKGIATANEKANVQFQELSHIPPEHGMEIIHDYQAGKPTPASEQIKATFDKLREEAISRGIPVAERKNYLPQVWADEGAAVVEAMTKLLKDKGLDEAKIGDYLSGKPLARDISNRLKLSPSFDKQRAFESYAEGQKYGLTPKYESPAQLAAHYRNDLERTITNRDFLQKLKDTGKLTENMVQGFKPIDVAFSAGEQLYAPPKLAKTLNEYFRDEDNLGLSQKFFKAGSKVNKALMEINLSGGVPLTNLNFFTIGQAVKSLTAGEGKVLGRVIMANSDKATKGWFRSNQSYINDMAAEGINLSSRTGNWDTFYNQLSSKKGFDKVKEKVGSFMNTAFNKKTFDNFMPMQTISTFKNAYDAAIGKGLPEVEARKLAAETTRAWNGIIEDWGRSKDAQDKISSLLFAPRFREGIVNLIANSARSMTTEWKNPAFKMNRRYVAGTALTFIAMNLLNKEVNGNYMIENEPGHELELKIPYGDGQIMYIPIAPSVLAFPRNMVTGTAAFATGDFKTAGQKLGSLASMPVKLAAEVMNNKDYFGNPIYDENSPGQDKLKDIASYVGLGYNHPYVKYIYDFSQGKRDIAQTLSLMAELPVKFGSQLNINKGKFYNALEKHDADRTTQRKEVQDLYDNLQRMKAEGKQAEADEIYAKLPQEEKDIYKSIKSSAKAAVTKTNKVNLYTTYAEIKDLKAAGKQAEADAIYNEFTPEEKAAYKLLRKQFD